MKSLFVIEKKKRFFLKFENFNESDPPTRHIKYKENFASCKNKLWQISFLHPMWNGFFDRLNLRLHVNRQLLNPNNFTKSDHR